MVIENRIKGIYIWVMSVIYLALFIVDIFHSKTNFPLWFSISFPLITLLLIVSGVIIFYRKYFLNISENLFIFAITFLLSIIIIQLTNGIESFSFPILFLLSLSFTAFFRERKLFIATTIFGFSFLFSWILLAKGYRLFFNIDFILSIMVYWLGVMVIRNYPLACLDCTNITGTCRYNYSCILVEMKNNLGDEVDGQLFEES